MSDFHESRKVKGRKAYRCEQCGQPIEAGCEHIYAAGRWEGDFYTQRIHLECDAAALDYARELNLWNDEFPWFSEYPDFEPGDWEWMVDRHPIVAARLGWDKKLEERKRDMSAV